MNPKTKVRGKMPLLTAAEEHDLRLRQLMGVFSMADSTLAGHRVVCQLQDSTVDSMNGAPAASSRGNITFNQYAIREVNTVEGLVNVNGLNYHELAHVLFTPQGGDLVKRINADHNHQAFNVLEDQRIETLLVAKYPTVAPYLVATCAEYFMTVDPSTHASAWPYLYGRKYLPKKMRAYFEAEAKTPAMTSTMLNVERIIDEYRLLDVHDRSNFHRAAGLVERFAQCIGKTQQHSPFGHQGAHQAATGSAGGQSGQAAATDAAADKDAAGEHGEIGDAPADSDGSDSSDAGKDQGGGGDQAGAGDPNAPIRPGDAKSFQEAMKNIKRNAAAQDNVISDVRLQREAMTMGKRFTGSLPKPKRVDVPVTDEARRAANQFGKQLSRLVAESDPGFHTHRSSGRVNVGRAMQGASLDEVFDEWDSGKQDADSIEMVVLLDTSGSMNSTIAQVAETGWILKAGTESLGRNASVSVISFGDNSTYVYPPGSVAAKTSMKAVRAGGGTRPIEGIREALTIFANSTRKRKLCLFVTDGTWSEPYTGNTRFGNMTNDDGIARMNSNGITTATVFIADAYARGAMMRMSPEEIVKQFGHGCNVFALVDDVSQLQLFGKKLVRSALTS